MRSPCESKSGLTPNSRPIEYALLRMERPTASSQTRYPVFSSVNFHSAGACYVEDALPGEMSESSSKMRLGASSAYPFVHYCVGPNKH